MTDENYEARAQAHLASIKRDMKASMEDAVVRAMHKVMAEFEAKSDERLMEDWGPGPHEHHSLPAREPEQPAQQEQGDSICQEDDGCPTELAVLQRFWRGQYIPYEHYPTWCKPAQRKPLTHEQRFDLLTKFEPHKNKWEAPAILIDMVEAAHGIGEKK